MYVNGSNTFNSLYALYEQYRIIGVKVKVMPMNPIMKYTTSAAVGTTGGVMDCASASFINKGVNPTTTTNNNMESAFDYKTWTLSHGIHKEYRKVGKFFWKEGYKWLNTNTNGATPTWYPDACTLYRIIGSGMDTNSAICSIRATWYVAFKGMFFP